MLSSWCLRSVSARALVAGSTGGGPDGALGLGGGEAGMAMVKSRSGPGVPPLFGAGPAAGFAGAAAGFAEPAGAVPEVTSRTKPSLSSWRISCWNFASNGLPTRCATSDTVSLPSKAESTARSARASRLVLPEASWTPLPDLE